MGSYLRKKEKRKIMTYKRKKFSSQGLLCIGLILMILGFISLNIENINSTDKSLTFGSRISISISITSLGLGLFSLGLAFSSSIKNNINSNENFLRIVDHFEDKRIEIFQHATDGDFRPLIRNIWKMVTYTQRAIKLYEMANITKENCDPLFEQLKQLLFWSMIPWRGIPVFSQQPSGIVSFNLVRILRKEDIQHVISICTLFEKFRLDKTQKVQLEAYKDMMEYIYRVTP